MSDNHSETTTVLLVCREGKSREVYQAALDLPGVSLVCVHALSEFYCPEGYCPLNGILVDMPTYMRYSEEEKRELVELVGIFPALRLKCHEPTGEIRSLPFGTVYPENSTSEVFVQKYCSAFVQRKIRTKKRVQLNLSVLLNQSLPVEGVCSVRSVTVNLSSEGCFLIGFEPLVVKGTGWLTIPELKDNTPIPVEVCWVRLWGEHRSLPGAGIRFVDLTDSQKDELGRLGE